MRSIIIMSCCIIGLFSCKSSEKTIDLKTYDGEKIVFGSGGGFTGRVTSHMLLPTGQMLKKGDTSSTFSNIQGIDEKIAKQMFTNWTMLGLDKLSIDDPGNMYFFLILTKDGKEQKFTWGGDKVPDPKIKTFYLTLRGLMNQPRSESK